MPTLALLCLLLGITPVDIEDRTSSQVMVEAPPKSDLTLCLARAGAYLCVRKPTSDTQREIEWGGNLIGHPAVNGCLAPYLTPTLKKQEFLLNLPLLRMLPECLPPIAAEAG